MEEKVTEDGIEILKNGVIGITYKLEIIKDGNIIAVNGFNKHIYPGDDFSGESEKIKSICSTVHTPEVVEKYKATSKNILPEE
jgi:hypothetical protein